MSQEERRIFLINYLLNENPEEYASFEIPEDELMQKRLLRSLMNVRSPKLISEKFLSVQDAYLQERMRERGVVTIDDLSPVRKGIYLWQGDITRLQVDAIVNAANNALLGCFIPCHGCIDNAIHTAAGIELRLECAKIMTMQNAPEPTGQAKITNAYNLPSRYILHTVGPIIRNQVSEKDERLLASCYRSCLELALACELKSVAFCCISTGEFHFPPERAAEIAIKTVDDFREKMSDPPEVVFNVYRKSDFDIYNHLL